MQLRIGSYTHDLGVPAVSIRKQTKRTDADTRISTIETWEIRGLIVSSSGAADLDSKVQAIKAAYRDGRDLRILLPDGSNSTHYLLNAACLGGTRVVSPPSFPSFASAAGVTNLEFVAVIEGEVVASGAPTSLLSFEETLQFTGGGPLDGHIETLAGSPIKQRLRQYTTYRATQSGSAVGYLSYPAYPAPIWPAAEVIPSRRTSSRSPRRKGSNYTEFPISWSYEFAASSPLAGRPHFWT